MLERVFVNVWPGLALHISVALESRIFCASRITICDTFFIFFLLPAPDLKHPQACMIRASAIQVERKGLFNLDHNRSHNAGFDTPVMLPPPLPVPLTLAVAISHFRVLLTTPGQTTRAEDESTVELAWADTTDMQV